MNNPIDIVIPYVNPLDKKWQESYMLYESKENINKNDEQLNPEIRFRDAGTLRYVLRSIDKYAKWVNNVFLILSDESQKPDWVSDKVKVVYHRDYIPENLLPTFNSNCIETFLYRINELSNNYILFNDDTFFLSAMNEDSFFIDNKPVYSLELSGERKPNNIFNCTLINNQKVISAITKRNEWWVHRHQPTPHLKSIEKQIIENNLELFISAFPSRFRHSSNFTPWLWNELAKTARIGVNKPELYTKSLLVEINSKTNYDNLVGLEMVCLNDTARNDDYDLSKIKMIEFLDKNFKEVCKYES